MSVSSVLVNFLLFWLLAHFVSKKTPALRYFKNFIWLFVSVALAWIIYSAIFYLFIPIFYDHSEANIASVAAVWRWGQEIYTDTQDSHRYSLLYGPLPYMVVAFFQNFGSETIFFSKIPGVLALFFSLAFVLLFARKLQATLFEQFLMVGSTALIFTGFYNYSYWIRPDSFLIFLCLAGLLLIRSVNSWWLLSLLLGLLAGVASGAKLHGVVYFMPLFAYAVEVTGKQHLKIKILIAGLASIAGLTAPFFVQGVTLSFYRAWIELASTHGLEWDLFLKNITFMMSFCVLAWVLGISRKYNITFLAYVATSFVVSVIGSKAGAGTNHLLPLLPLISAFCFEIYKGKSLGEQKNFHLVIGAFLMMLSLNGWNRQKRVVQLQKEFQVRTAEFQDFKNIVSKTTGPVEVGYSSEDSYISTFYKAWAVDKNGMLMLDAASLMDIRAAGIKLPESTYTAFETCAVGKVVLPVKGDPWSMSSYYEGQEILPDRLREIFDRKYRILETSEYFRMYECI